MRINLRSITQIFRMCHNVQLGKCDSETIRL